MRYFSTIVLFFVIAVASAQSPGQVVRATDYDDLEKIIAKDDSVLYVVNFWATWCVPCVEELPDFMKVNRCFSSGERFKMILVSLDNVKDLDKRVKPFLVKNNIQADVYLLDDNKRMNIWIPDVDQTWSGAIPATVLYRNGQKLYFHEGQLTEKELIEIVQKYL